MVRRKTTEIIKEDRLNIEISKELKQELKEYCVINNISIKDFVTIALTNELKKSKDLK